jgi:hypothetical protein
MTPPQGGMLYYYMFKKCSTKNSQGIHSGYNNAFVFLREDNVYDSHRE